MLKHILDMAKGEKNRIVLIMQMHLYDNDSKDNDSNNGRHNDKNSSNKTSFRRESCVKDLWFFLHPWFLESLLEKSYF